MAVKSIVDVFLLSSHFKKYIHVCVCDCMYVNIWIHIGMYMYVYICMYIYTNTTACMCVACMRVCMEGWMFLCDVVCCLIRDVVQVKTLPAGHSIGYGNTYITTAPEKVALVPIGYSDGFR